MLATQTGASFSRDGTGSGDVRVDLGSKRCGARLTLLLALAMAAALSGCGNVDLGSDQPWFRKPFDFAGKNAGYSYSDLTGSSRLNRPITANDLIDASGACPAAAQPQAAPAGAAAPATPPSALGEGVGLGMSECEVVERAGAPASVQIGNAPNGDRTTVLTYNSGPRPGVYHFERGRLMQMDAVAAPPPPPQTAKKKPAKPKKQANNNAT